MAFSEKVRQRHEKEFKNRMEQLYPSKLDLSKVVYINQQTSVILVCKIHGEYEAKPRDLITRGMCCKGCSKESHRNHYAKTFEDLVISFNEIHKNKYSYLKTKDRYNKNDELVVLCCKHGLFKQTVSTHRNGSGCRDCGYERQGCAGGYSFKNIDRDSDLAKSPMSLYIIKIHSEQETFYKVGLTKTSVIQRFCGSKLPYEYSVLKLIHGTTEDMFELEQLILSVADRYKPFHKFGGHTECFQSQNIETSIGELTI